MSEELVKFTFDLYKAGEKIDPKYEFNGINPESLLDAIEIGKDYNPAIPVIGCYSDKIESSMTLSAILRGIGNKEFTRRWESVALNEVAEVNSAKDIANLIDSDPRVIMNAAMPLVGLVSHIYKKSRDIFGDQDRDCIAVGHSPNIEFFYDYLSGNIETVHYAKHLERLRLQIVSMGGEVKQVGLEYPRGKLHLDEKLVRRLGLDK